MRFLSGLDVCITALSYSYLQVYNFLPVLSSGNIVLYKGMRMRVVLFVQGYGSVLVIVNSADIVPTGTS